MERLYGLKKGAGKGKTVAIISITNCNSFSKMQFIKNVSLKNYSDYLKYYVGYDKVYIIGTSEKKQKINTDYFDEDCVFFDIAKPNLLKDLNVDDVVSKQHPLIFFGGALHMYYFSICNRLCEWYEEHGDKHFYMIQDDPDFITINPALYVERRIDGADIQRDVIPYSYDRNHPDVKIYMDFHKKGTLHNCFNNTIVAFCGSDYPTFFEVAKTNKPGTPNVITEAKYWDEFLCYTWQGVNENLDRKFTDYDFDNKPYVSEYHGATKHDKLRITTTENMYNSLDDKILVIHGKKEFSNNFKNFDLEPTFEYNKLWDTVCSKAKTTFITGNSSTWNTFIMPRYFDLMLGDIIAFVYGPYDGKRLYTDNEELKNFMYVDTPEQFRERVYRVANDKEYYEHIKYLQRKSIYDNYKDFMLDSSIEKFKEKLNLS